MTKEKGCTCPVGSMIPPIECPVVHVPFDSVKLYGKSLVALGDNDRYLGQWKYYEELNQIIITKTWNKQLLEIDLKTGDAKFFTIKKDASFVGYEDTTMVVEIPPNKRFEVDIYCDGIDFNKTF